jgi:sulfate transport system permease protein
MSGLRASRRRNVIPGFGISLGFTIVYLSLIILIPLGGVLLKSAGLGWEEFLRIAGDERTLRAIWLSVWTALAAALINVPFGVLVAWVMVRYSFPGRRFLDAAVDLPFALPTAVAGIALTALYAPNGWIGGFLEQAGIKAAYTPLGIVIALTFIGLPFVVRTVQPLLEDIDKEVEEAAATLGAGRLDTVRRVILPAILPAVITGFALAFARAIGEYGSVVFIAGNIPYVSEIAPLLIIIRLEEYNYAGATTVATLMLAISFALLVFINGVQAWTRRRYGNG